jgi:TolA-binding protein
MNLRRCFLPQQYLFAALILAAQARPAAAQHKVVLKNGKTTEAEVVGVSGSNLRAKVDAGTLEIPLPRIARVEMPPPAGYDAAMKAFNAQDYPTAVAETKVLVDRFRGIPVDWAQQLSGMLGELYIELGKYNEAGDAYEQFRTAYPRTRIGPVARGPGPDRDCAEKVR